MVNSAGNDGVFYGNPALFMIQLKAVLITLFYSAIVTAVIYKVVDLVLGMRVSPKDEDMGLDLTEHHERAYTMLE
jgi:Amt family ammonium transporter